MAIKRHLRKRSMATKRGHSDLDRNDCMNDSTVGPANVYGNSGHTILAKEENILTASYLNHGSSREMEISYVPDLDQGNVEVVVRGLEDSMIPLCFYMLYLCPFPCFCKMFSSFVYAVGTIYQRDKRVGSKSGM